MQTRGAGENRGPQHYRRGRSRLFALATVGILAVVLSFATVLWGTLYLNGSKDNDGDTWLLHPPLEQEAPFVLENNNSAVEFFACCGLGHRLGRMAGAYRIARTIGFELRTFWGWCGPTEVFSHFFRPEPAKDLSYVNSTHQVIKFMNNVPGMKLLQRNASLNGKLDSSSCACQNDTIQLDYHFYSSLRQRFRKLIKIRRFMHDNRWSEHTVYGLHIRAGNGETGDFRSKNRTIPHLQEWIMNVVHNLERLHYNLSQSFALPPPLLHIATDTPLIIPLFRGSLNWTVSELPNQDRLQLGEGVIFGAAGQLKNRLPQNECLQRWEDVINDMMLLSYSDVIVAARISSFTQTLPMSLAFGRPYQHRKVPTVYCEVVDSNYHDNTSNDTSRQQQRLECFASYMDWCCNHQTWFYSMRRGQKIYQELLPVLPRSPNIQLYDVKVRPENLDMCYPRKGNRTKTFCLPHQWKTQPT